MSTKEEVKPAAEAAAAKMEVDEVEKKMFISAVTNSGERKTFKEVDGGESH